MITQDALIAAGYRPYTDSFKTSQWYLGSLQKRVRSARGTAYFINVDFWEFDGRKSAAAHVQFYTDDEDREFINVERPAPTTVEALEGFFAEVWSKLALDYYEEDEPPVAPSPPMQGEAPGSRKEMGNG